MTQFLQSDPLYFPASAVWQLPSIITLDIWAIKAIGSLRGGDHGAKLARESMPSWQKIVASYTAAYKAQVHDYFEGIKAGAGAWASDSSQGACSAPTFKVLDAKAMGCYVATIDGQSLTTTKTYEATTVCTFQGHAQTYTCTNACADQGNSAWKPSCTGRRVLGRRSGNGGSSGCNNERGGENNPPAGLKTCFQDQFYQFGVTEGEELNNANMVKYITTPVNSINALYEKEQH